MHDARDAPKGRRGSRWFARFTPGAHTVIRGVAKGIKANQTPRKRGAPESGRPL